MRLRLVRGGGGEAEEVNLGALAIDPRQVGTALNGGEPRRGGISFRFPTGSRIDPRQVGTALNSGERGGICGVVWWGKGCYT